MFLLHNHHSVKREYDNRQIVFAPNVQVSNSLHRNSSNPVSYTHLIKLVYDDQFADLQKLKKEKEAQSR